jgi:hypothetical protein
VSLLEDQGLIWAAQSDLNQAQNELNHARSLQHAYQQLKSKADSRWKEWQKAEAAKTAAGNALSLAQGAYARAVATANTLTGDAQAAAAAATKAESQYEQLKDRYDRQQQAKGKPKKHPGPQPEPCSTTCVKPRPRPHPIPLPAPGGSTPNPSPPGQGPGPSQGPSPNPGGAGQGSGSGGGSGQPPAPSCSDDGQGPVQAYEVGQYGDLVKRSPVGDQLAIHHVPQGQPAGQVIPGYSYPNAPAIALPAVEHNRIPNLKGTYNGSAQDLLARDIGNLRTYTNAPESAIQQLLDLNGQTFPDTFGGNGC